MMGNRKKDYGDILINLFGGLFIICCSVIMISFTIYAVLQMFS